MKIYYIYYLFNLFTNYNANEYVLSIQFLYIKTSMKNTYGYNYLFEYNNYDDYDASISSGI